MKYCNEINENGIICGKCTTYGDINDEFPKYCSNCSKNKQGKIVNYKHGYCKEVINLNGKLLSEKLCGKNANFNFIDCKIKKGIRCIEHKVEGMLCINGKICIECKESQASFILPNSNKKSATHCGKCIDKLKVEKKDISHKKCIICNENSAIFGKDKKEFCGNCVKENNLDVVNLHHRKCINCNLKEAVFNIEEEKPLYCGDCKNDNMINIYGLKCEECKIKTPVYNYPGEKNKRFCFDCKLEGMVNVKDKLCEKCNIKRPSFNYIGRKSAIYCNDCKLNEMININYDLCQIENCNENALYNYEYENKPIFCEKHSEDEMINIINITCLYPSCKKYPCFNFPNETKKLYCTDHKLEGMIDVKHLKCKKCCNRSSFNYYGEKKPIYCSIHKEDIMINICHPVCKTHLCGTKVSEKYDGYCMICFINLFPDKPITRNYCTKEIYVRNFILDTFPNYSWITDKKIKDGCSKRRPDLLLDLGYQIIIVEIDENQHINYDSSCEYKRLVDISDDLGNRPIILIRFNPDDYILEDGTKNQSCWSINNKGLCTIKKTYQKEWGNRLNILKEKIIFWLTIENKTNDLIKIEHLFFDIYKI